MAHYLVLRMRGCSKIKGIFGYLSFGTHDIKRAFHSLHDVIQSHFSYPFSASLSVGTIFYSSHYISAGDVLAVCASTVNEVGNGGLRPTWLQRAKKETEMTIIKPS